MQRMRLCPHFLLDVEYLLLVVHTIGTGHYSHTQRVCREEWFESEDGVLDLTLKHARIDPGQGEASEIGDAEIEYRTGYFRVVAQVHARFQIGAIQEPGYVTRYAVAQPGGRYRSEEHTSELKSLMRI